jgi:hypothetical protein
LTWFQTEDQWFTAFNEVILKDSPSPQYLCYIFKRDYLEINRNGSLIIKPSIFIQIWINTTEVPMSSSNTSPAIMKKKDILYNYLVALNKDIVPGDFEIRSETQSIDQASSSKLDFSAMSILGFLDYNDMQDSYDPYEDDGLDVNWDGCGLFWDITFSPEYNTYHN